MDHHSARHRGPTDGPHPRHLTVAGPAGRLHVVTEGDGPLVLLVHGFPESWFSWRFQLPALAAAGYRAAALDVRGYGRSCKPAAVDAYRMAELVEDLAAVIGALGNGPAVVVGHDWGSPITANTALLRPDVVRAVALLSVPYVPRGGPRPTDLFARTGQDEVYYIDHFQPPGRVEAEIESDVEGWLAGIFASLSGDTGPTDRARSPLFLTPGEPMRSRFVSARPAWLDPDTLAFYTAEFERTGFAGALARYRNVDRDWEDLVDLDAAPLPPPSLYVGGALDPVVRANKRALTALPVTMPGLRGNHVLDGVGHWVQQEAPDAVNRLLVDWLRELDG